MSQQRVKDVLVDQKIALSLFLESLLTETCDDKVAALETTEAVASVETFVDAQPQETETRIVLDEARPIAQTINPQLLHTGIQVEQEQQPQSIEIDPAETPEVRAQQPQFVDADQPFQVLMFKVAGLVLAVPLIELSGVLEWPEAFTPMPGHADFYLGLVTHLGSNVPVVDTARLVLPREKIVSLGGEDPLQRVQRIVLIDDSRWGLACDEIAEVITLEPEQVRWRSSRSKRPWLAGTVIEHMCALLDTQAFAKILENDA